MSIWIFVGVVVAAAIVLLYLGLSQPTTVARVQRRRDEMLAQQQAGATTANVRSAISEELSASFVERVLHPVFQAISARMASAAPEGMIQEAGSKLAAAGHPMGMSEPVFLLLRGLACLIGAGASYAAYMQLESAQPPVRLAVSLLALVVIALGPDYMVSNMVKARQTAIRRSLPDLLDLLVVCTEAGMGLDGALAEVVARKEGPLVDEFNRTLVEVRLGKRRNEAWDDLAERVDVQELSMLVAALYQAQTLGVSIARALRTHSDALRSQRSIRIKEQGAVLATKMLFPMVLCIFPALFVVILGPGAVQIMRTVGGPFGGG
jgi:tight adherence protein C